jgi:hypothetical protein
MIRLSDPDLFNAICVTVFRYMTRGQYIPVKRIAPGSAGEIDLVELGIACFSPDMGGGFGWYLDEPVTITAFLNFCKAKKPFKSWLSNQWKASAQFQGYVYEDIIIYKIHTALSQKEGCWLDSILDFHGKAPEWASAPVKLVTPRYISDHPDTVPITASSLLYACSAPTWPHTVIWLQVKTDSPVTICVPDIFMGPDLLCIVELSHA